MASQESLTEILAVRKPSQYFHRPNCAFHRIKTQFCLCLFVVHLLNFSILINNAYLVRNTLQIETFVY